MLNIFGSSSSVSCQFLVFESPLFQVSFMKNNVENSLFEGLCYNHKGFELFSKRNFESSWVFEGLKSYVVCAALLVFGIDFFRPISFKVKTIVCSGTKKTQISTQKHKIKDEYLFLFSRNF